MRKTIFTFILCSISYLLFCQSPGQIGNDQVICYGSAPARLVFTEAPSGGTPGYSYRWRRSNDGTNWNDIAGTTASLPTYSPPVLGRTAHFRCRVTDSQNATLGETNIVTITVRPELTAGSVVAAETRIFSGTAPANLVETTAASGGGGNYSYRWQISQDGMYWSDISGATIQELSPEAIMNETWYRRWVVDAACGSTAGSPVRIDVEAITLYKSGTTTSESYWGRFDLGTEFEVLTEGFITHARLHTPGNEGGIHEIRIWRQNNDLSGYELITGPFEWSFSAGITGWREFILPTPVAVEPGRRYIVSITTGTDNPWFSHSMSAPVEQNNYVRYIGGVYTSTIGTVPNIRPDGDSYFRDIIFVPFSAGLAGTSQTVCYNSTPSPLTQISPPSGASGGYTFRWQSSSDGTIWNDIEGAVAPDFSPTDEITSNVYYRRVVTSGIFTRPGPPVLIAANSPMLQASPRGDITIFENTSTFFNVEITGGTPPYRIEYSRNGSPQSPITGYTSGADIFTGVLGAGEYNYSLVSVSDVFGCVPASLGDPITINVSGSYSGTVSQKALLLVRPGAVRYGFYYDHIRPYLEWFGIPYEICDVSSTPLPDFNNYALIIFGHENVFESQYPVEQIVTAVSNGIGLYSFDPYLFHHTIGTYSSSLPQITVNSQEIIIPNTTHYITEYHADDKYNIPINSEGRLSNNYDVLTKHNPTEARQNNELIGGISLAEMSDGTSTITLLEVAEQSPGRIVKWNDYLWMDNAQIGYLYGMDDLLWRSMVWAAKKPFIMQGMPPMITMRVDDVDGTYGTEDMRNLQWLDICNEFGFIPWLGIFLYYTSEGFFDTLRDLINRNLATASPHAFWHVYETSAQECIYYNYNNAPQFSVADSVMKAADWFAERNLPMSNYMIAHNYLIRSEALPGIRNMGIEFIGTKIECDRIRGVYYPGSALELEPYMVNRYMHGGPGAPFFYADSVNWNGNDFFICLTEIGDDAGYEWAPHVVSVDVAIARGVRQLRRALNSMVLPVLFTHEYYLDKTAEEWREILGEITSAVASYNPEYKSTDDALRYVRAKKNIRINDAREDNGLISISCTGVNEMQTSCYLFTESDNQITHRLISLPRVTSSATPVTVVFSNQ